MGPHIGLIGWVTYVARILFTRFASTKTSGDLNLAFLYVDDAEAILQLVKATLGVAEVVRATQVIVAIIDLIGATVIGITEGLGTRIIVFTYLIFWNGPASSVGVRIGVLWSAFF